MIKGYQKRIIHLKNTNSPYFEEAYFILKDCESSRIKENDMVKEAMRIAQSSSMLQKGRQRDRRTKKPFPVLAVVSAFSFAFGIAMLLLAIFA